MIFPSLYEGWGLPVQESMRAGRPVACSDAGPLPFVASSAALLFDGHDVGQIADAMRNLWTDADLCAALVEKGRAAIAGFTWESTARSYREIYRRIAHDR